MSEIIIKIGKPSCHVEPKTSTDLKVETSKTKNETKTTSVRDLSTITDRATLLDFLTEIRQSVRSGGGKPKKSRQWRERINTEPLVQYLNQNYPDLIKEYTKLENLRKASKGPPGQ